MGAPFDTGTWNGVTESIYNASGTEALWLFISIALCCVALWMGGKHESEAYDKAESNGS
ncbi:MAG: hypothetical protein AAF441_14765 [Pseudomonadota bacterium]